MSILRNQAAQKGLLLLISCYFVGSILSSLKQSEIQTIYKGMSGDLMNLRRSHPESQASIYRVLDQLGKMYATVRDAKQKKKDLKELVKTKDLENIALHDELILLKTDNDAMQEKLADMTKKLNQYKSKTSYLLKEKKQLLTQRKKEKPMQLELTEKEEEEITQNLLKSKGIVLENEAISHTENLNSSSEPTSPR